MAKKEKVLRQEQKKKVPFNVLRKGAIAGLLGLTIGFGCLGLAGCSNGQDGKDGTQWLNGTATPTATQGVNGDYYYDTDDYLLYQKTNGEWKIIVRDFGKQGAEGQSVYLGYDGYVWQDGVKTTFKLDQDEETNKGVVEDTIGAYTTMQYWAGEYVDLSTNSIALMSNYKPTAKLTQYSGTKVTEIQVVAENAGTLHIGTAKVADIVTARTTGTTYTANTTEKTLVAGLNTISLNLTVAEDETIVIGGSNSTAKVYVVKNLPVSDEQGNFALVNGSTNTDVISKTGDYADTLAVRVKAESKTSVSKLQSIFPNLLTEYPESSISSLSVASKGEYRYADSSNISGKTIKQIGIAVKSLDKSKPLSFVVYKIKNSVTENFSSSGTKITLTLPENSVINTWVYVDCYIELANDETIAFESLDTPAVGWGFSIKSGYGFVNDKGQTFNNMSLTFDIKVTETESVSPWEGHLEQLEKTEQKAIQNAKKTALKASLNNKNFSILGDSISTYSGYSNNGTNTNSYTTSNNVEYNGSNHGISSVDQTWWKQIADMTGMNVLVNNSSAGDKVTAGGQTRCTQLHDNTGENSGTNPDIIAVYLGVNDFDDNSISLETFTAKYTAMIDSIKETYTNSDVYVFTLIPNKFNSGSYDDERMQSFNNAIKNIANEKDCTTVDLYADSGITFENVSNYMGDTNGLALHPNEAGMDLMTECFWNVLYEKYVTNAD